MTAKGIAIILTGEPTIAMPVKTTAPAAPWTAHVPIGL